jgi:formylglycine-generating enzyme required for sulfatase activity
MSSNAFTPLLPEMVLVPAGPFLMGTSDQQIKRLASAANWAKKWSAKGLFHREQPQHAVTLPNYRIGKYPVTVFQFKRFIQGGGYRQPGYWTEAGWRWRVDQGHTQPDHWRDGTWVGQPKLPLVGVSWYEAWAYCCWLKQQTGQPFRLPSEAEWEKAARGTDGRSYPWGDLLQDDRFNSRASGLNRTVTVDQYHPAGDSPYGCVQMIGNVSEWTLSQFKPYPYVAADGREDPEGRLERVTRGGSWFSPPFRTRTAARGLSDPSFADHDLGFRVLCEVLPVGLSAHQRE